jgi:hypothetical protein
MIGVKGDVKVVIARQTVLGHIGNRALHDATQGVFDKKIVFKLRFRHERLVPFVNFFATRRV